MQVRLTAHERHRHFIAATVVIVRSMERLVYIANEMDEVREAVVLGHAVDQDDGRTTLELARRDQGRSSFAMLITSPARFIRAT
jgi:hypothetical protein